MRLAVLLLAALPAVAEPLPLPVLDGGEVSRNAEAPDDPTVGAALDAFAAGADAFAAFYAGDGGAFGWHGGAFTESDARLVAEALCRLDGTSGCRLIALAAPAEATDVGLPLHAVEGAAEGWAVVPDGAYFAIAVMPTGAHGYAFDAGDSNAAEAEAMVQCRARRFSEFARDGADVGGALAKAGAYDCRVLLSGRK